MRKRRLSDVELQLARSLKMKMEDELLGSDEARNRMEGVRESSTIYLVILAQTNLRKN